MISVTTASRIEGYQMVAYEITAQGASFDDFLKGAEALGANAILNACYDDAIDADTLFHGAAVVIGPIRVTVQHLAGGTSVFTAHQSAKVTGEAV